MVRHPDYNPHNAAGKTFLFIADWDQDGFLFIQLLSGHTYKNVLKTPEVYSASVESFFVQAESRHTLQTGSCSPYTHELHTII